ncbi:WYL domain-containing protein [Neobacillus sp. D3-1R]|uniref:WYL domain-containing protein n=1 Tax=Neobacillus sp. D3-1R TaxID=3445778 RepID=UPI003F9F7EC9
MRGILLRASERQLPVEMIYLSKNGAISQRKIRVVDLKEDRVKAYCFLRKGYRIFCLSNILSVSPIQDRNKGAFKKSVRVSDKRT